MMSYDKDIMSAEFTKHFIDLHDKGSHLHLVVHHFTAPDIGGPHDHPFGFRTHILKGHYVEKVYNPKTGSYTFTKWNEGTVHFVDANTVHEIVGLSDGGCWTAIFPQEKTREWGFWQFRGDGSYFKQHDLPEWVKQ